MNPEAQAMLDAIVLKEVPELSANDIAFLRARAMYLTSEQEEKFATVLTGSTPETEEVEEFYISTKDLKKKAQQLGIPHKGVSREDLVVAISTIEGPAGAVNPQ